MYTRLENDTENPDFITNNDFARIGIVENPSEFGSSITLTRDKASAVGALKLVGAGYSEAIFSANALFTQTISTGTTAVARVISYEQTTGVLKYWQDRSQVGFNTNGSLNPTPTYGFDQVDFTSEPDTGGSLNIVPSSGQTLQIDAGYTGISTVINNRTYYFGLSFIDGLANPEVKKHSGNIIYVDNRPSTTRSVNQKEDIKIILQF